ncbi:MAG TPA: ABC transporter permease subunit [Acetobacteraceae bacterium]|nr:ABC transporter permease subunit [Acetobacteraceae bacterium]
MRELDFLGATMLQLLGGVPLTVGLTAGSVAAGAVLALLLALLRANSRPGAALVSAYVFVFRGTPLLLQIFFIYYGAGQFAFVRASVLWPFLREPWCCALLALALNDAAYASEILRGGFAAVPKGAVEAGRAVGMTRLLLLRRVVLPLAIRQALPAYGNELIAMVKSTSLASLVTLMEVTGIAYAIISETYRAIEVFLCAGAIYLVLNFALTRAVAVLEAKLGPAGT